MFFLTTRNSEVGENLKMTANVIRKNGSTPLLNRQNELLNRQNELELYWDSDVLSDWYEGKSTNATQKTYKVNFLKKEPFSPLHIHFCLNILGPWYWTPTHPHCLKGILRFLSTLILAFIGAAASPGLGCLAHLFVGHVLCLHCCPSPAFFTTEVKCCLQ